MRIHASMRLAAVVLLVAGARLDAEEKPNQQRAMDTLQELGARCEADANRPGRPVVAVDLDHSDVHGDTLKLLKLFPHLHTVRWREGWLIGQDDMKMLGALTQLRNLDIWAWRIKDDWLESLEGLTNLESLTLHWGEVFTDEGLRHLRRLTTLRSLNLQMGVKITDEGLAHLRGLTNLSHLDLGGTKTSDKGLVCLKNLCHLETLNLASTEVGDKGLVHIEDLVQLRSLNLSHTQVTDKGLEHLKKLKKLQHLDLFTYEIEGEGVKNLKSLTNLRSLRIGADMDGKAMAVIEKMTSLRKLSIYRGRRITDENMCHLRGLSNLESLELWDLQSVTDKGLNPLRKLTRLRSLSLSHIDGLTNVGLVHLRELSNLRVLRLSQYTINDAGLQQLKGLTGLRRLELNGLSITDRVGEIIKGFPNLRGLRLSNSEITDNCLQHLQGLTDLRELDVGGTYVSDAGLLFLGGLCRLQILRLPNTPVTNRGLGHLKAMPNLRTIDVEDTNVTDTGVDSFRESRPGSKVIRYRARVQWTYDFTPPRRVAPASERLVPLVHILADSDDASLQLDVLRGMYEALQGRRKVTAPEGWSAVYRKLAGSENGEVREKVLQLSVLFGDPQALAVLRKMAADPKANTVTRRTALQTLVEKRPPDLLPLLRKLLSDRALRGLALRGLASYSDPATPPLILEHYASLTDAEKADAIATLASRPTYALALLDAMEKGRVPRRDLSAFTVRQLLAFNDKKLTDRLTTVWGSIRPPSAEKATLLPKYKAMVPPDALKKADRKHGRLLYARTCASCHTLFNDGGKIGPDLTGSQRANPEYLLIKLLDPSAVVAKDYQMTVITTTAGRTISGLVKEETDKTITMQTQNEVVRLPKSDIEERSRSSQSMMPDGLLTPLNPAEVRDLIAYVSGPGQVPLPPSAPGSHK